MYNINSKSLLLFPLSLFVCVSNPMEVKTTDPQVVMKGILDHLDEEYNLLLDNKADFLVGVKDVKKSLENYEKRAKDAKCCKDELVASCAKNFYSSIKYLDESFSIELLDLGNNVHRKFLNKIAIDAGILPATNVSREARTLIHQAWNNDAKSNCCCAGSMLSAFVYYTEFEDNIVMNAKLIFSYPQIQKNRYFSPYLLSKICRKKCAISKIKALRDYPTLQVSLACSFINYLMANKDLQEAERINAFHSVISDFFIKDKVYSQEVVDTLLNHPAFPEISFQFASAMVKFVFANTDIDLANYHSFNDVCDDIYLQLLRNKGQGRVVNYKYNVLNNYHDKWKFIKNTLNNKFIPSLKILAAEKVQNNFCLSSINKETVTAVRFIWQLAKQAIEKEFEIRLND